MAHCQFLKHIISVKIRWTNLVLERIGIKIGTTDLSLYDFIILMLIWLFVSICHLTHIWYVFKLIENIIFVHILINAHWWIISTLARVFCVFSSSSWVRVMFRLNHWRSSFLLLRWFAWSRTLFIFLVRELHHIEILIIKLLTLLNIRCAQRFIFNGYCEGLLISLLLAMLVHW